MTKLLLTGVTTLLVAGTAVAAKPDGKLRRPAPPRDATRREVTQPPRPQHHVPKDQGAAQTGAVWRRIRGESHTLQFPPPEIWLSSSPPRRVHRPSL